MDTRQRRRYGGSLSLRSVLRIESSRVASRRVESTSGKTKQNETKQNAVAQPTTETVSLLFDRPCKNGAPEIALVPSRVQCSAVQCIGIVCVAHTRSTRARLCGRVCTNEKTFMFSSSEREEKQYVLCFAFLGGRSKRGIDFVALYSTPLFFVRGV
mmetsp:Transcript_7296/g.14339  ORF Transcript_7296/g.14339 Transcript_7296/m.14339 type:complete len:156 (+) Transcript_7296:153-620(+)